MMVISQGPLWSRGPFRLLGDAAKMVRMAPLALRHLRRLAPILLLASLLGPTGAHAGCDDPPAAGVQWQDCEKHRLILRKADLTGAKLAGADFNGSDLESAKLAGADLSRASLDRVRLSQADLSRARLVQVKAYRTNFSKARMAGADLTKGELARANLSGADLSGAQLGKAEFQRASLDGANLTGADLRGADFTRATLAQAKLAGAQLAETRLYLTRIEGVDLSATTGLVQARLDEACGDARTLLPKGLKPAQRWPCGKDD